MIYIYAGLLLHKAGKQISEENVKKVLTAAGVHVDEARVKALVAALEGVNIEEAIKKASLVAAAPVAAAAPAVGEKKEEKKKEEKSKEEAKKAEEAAAAGLGSLFG